MEYFFLKRLYHLNGLSKKCQVGPKLKRIKTGFERNKKRSGLQWKITPRMRKNGSFYKIWLKNWLLTQKTYSGYPQYTWIQMFPKTTSKYLPYLRPIWDQWLKPFRNESNLKEDHSSEKFCQFDSLVVTKLVPHVLRGSDSCKKFPAVTNH